MKIVEFKHPLVKHKLGLMREQDISTKRFRELASEVGSLLTYEATADLETEKVTIEGWNGPVEIDQIKGKKITVEPILREGLGMMDGVLENVPCARISVVGMYRNEETLEPVPYFQKLVSNIDERMAPIVDPMLATGGSVIATIHRLKKAGYQAECLHGDVRQSFRDKVMSGFRKGEFEILVATDVAARGIDVDDVEAVFNYDLPDKPEFYAHRIGRTGRAKRAGVSFSFVSFRDSIRLDEILKYIDTKPISLVFDNFRTLCYKDDGTPYLENA